MATAQTLIEGALKDLGVLGAGEAADADDLTDALVALNDMASSLGLERLTLYQRVRTTKTLTASTASYTIGSAGSIALDRPLWIDEAKLVYDTTASTPTEIPLDILTDQQYAAWPQKTLTSSQSQAIFYDYGLNASGYGTIYVLPIPTVNTTQLVLYTPGGALSTFADTTTDYVVPRGWNRMLRKNLALELAPMFQAQPSPLLVKQAAESKAVVKIANVRPLPLDGPPRGRWRIEAGAW
jgi:hypothetical protein